MAEMKVFKCITQTVLYISAFDETILVLMYDISNDILCPVCQKLSKKFKRQTNQRDWSEIIHALWIGNFWNEGNVGSVDALDVTISFKEIPNHSVKILIYNIPAPF